MSNYDARPWTAHYTEAMLAPPSPPAPSLLQPLAEAVAQVPDRTALAYFDGTLSYAELDRLAGGFAGYLVSRGFRRGDRLVVDLQNIPQFVIAVLGTWLAGGVVVPANPMYRQREMRHIVADAGVSAVVCAEHAWQDQLGEVVTAAGIGIAVTTSELELQSRNDSRVLPGHDRPVIEGAVDLLTVARRHADRRPPDPGLTAGDIALISYTSGTSGKPKGATNTHGNITTNGRALREYRHLDDGAGIFALAPLFHITGMVSELAAAITLAGTLSMAYRFDAGVVLDALREHRPQFMVGPSTAYMALMAHPDISKEHFSSLRLLYSGGAPVPPALVEQFRDRFGHYIRNGYGLTETTAGCVSVPAELEAPVDPASGTLSVGIPTPGTMVWVLDDDGNEVPIGEPGEITFAGPSVVPGYWNADDATKAAWPDGRFRTGDVGFMDADGWLYLVDRKKDMINASGFKVWPREVEDVLYTHPAVSEAAVVGKPDPYRGETVKAFVSLREDGAVSADELIAWCRQRMAAYKYPREVEVLPELPKTFTGKILRRELRG